VTDDSDRKKKPSQASNRKVDLSALGYAERRTSPRREKPGTIGFDELGNAQFQWNDERLLEDGDEADTRRQRSLSIANLVLVDDEPPPDTKTISTNKNGLRVGYNPYDSGRLPKQQWKKPKDLRALSKWIEAQKRATDSGSDSGSDGEEK
jgi:hypothetical protein